MTDHGQTMKILERVWAQTLGVKKVGPDDNFFALGGHSLLGVRLIASVQEKLEIGAELQLSDLVEFPTLEGFAHHIAALMAPAEESGEI